MLGSGWVDHPEKGFKKMGFENLNNGYCGWSMSVNAKIAYENGEKPFSKWTKKDLLNIIAHTKKADFVDWKKLNTENLKSFLSYSSWHHVGKYCSKVDFYEFDYDKLQEFTKEQFNKLIIEQRKNKRNR